MYSKDNTFKALRDLRVAYFKLNDCWNNESKALNSDTSIRFYPFKKSFDEIELDIWVEEILDMYTDLDLILSKDKGRYSEDYDLNLEERVFVALKEFRKAWFDVYTVWEDNEILDSQVSLNYYPFDESMGGIYVYDWIDYIIENEM